MATEFKPRPLLYHLINNYLNVPNSIRIIVVVSVDDE